MAEEPGNVVCITVPKEERMTQILRLATTAVASRTGLNLDQADDVKTALDELFRLIVSNAKADQQKFCVRYSIRDDSLEVVTEGIDVNLSDETSNVCRYCRFILEKMTDEVIEKKNPKGGFDVHIIKRTENG